MEDEKQLVRDLLAKPYSKQVLGDFISAFGDLRGRDRRALVDEFLSTPLGKDWEKLTCLFAQIFEKLGTQIETLTKIDLEQAILHFAPLIAQEKMRDIRAGNIIKEHAVFDTAVAAEADKLGKKRAISAKFANAVRPGLEAQGFRAGRDKVLEAVRRIKEECKRRKSTGS